MATATLETPPETAETIPPAERDAAPVVAEAPPAPLDATAEAAPESQQPEEVDRPTPAEKLPGEESVDAHTWQLILSARADEESALKRVEECKLDLREARSDFNAASKRLGALIDESRTPGLYNQPRSANGQAKTAGGGVGTAADAIREGLGRAAAEKDQEVFDAATLGQLGLGGKLKDNLEAEGIKTGKDLAAWLNAVPRRKVSGIGEDQDKGGLKKIIEAMEEFYLKRQRERVAGNGDPAVGVEAASPADAVPLAQAMGDPTPREADGKPKKFRGNKKTKKTKAKKKR